MNTLLVLFAAAATFESVALFIAALCLIIFVASFVSDNPNAVLVRKMAGIVFAITGVIWLIAHFLAS